MCLFYFFGAFQLTKKWFCNSIYYELEKIVNTKVPFFKIKLPSSTKTQQELFLKGELDNTGLNFELCHNGQNLGAFVPWLLGPWLLSPRPQNTPTTITTPYSPTQIRRLFTINILHSLVVWLGHHQSIHNFSGVKGG